MQWTVSSKQDKQQDDEVLTALIGRESTLAGIEGTDIGHHPCRQSGESCTKGQKGNEFGFHCGDLLRLTKSWRLHQDGATPSLLLAQREQSADAVVQAVEKTTMEPTTQSTTCSPPEK